MPPTRTILIAALLLLFANLGGGCAKKERVLGNLYEGIQMQNRQATPPNGSGGTTAPGYDEYLRQRREVIQEPAPVAPWPLTP